MSQEQLRGDEKILPPTLRPKSGGLLNSASLGNSNDLKTSDTRPRSTTQELLRDSGYCSHCCDLNKQAAALDHWAEPRLSSQSSVEFAIAEAAYSKK